VKLRSSRDHPILVQLHVVSWTQEEFIARCAYHRVDVTHAPLTTSSRAYTAPRDGQPAIRLNSQIYEQEKMVTLAAALGLIALRHTLADPAILLWVQGLLQRVSQGPPCPNNVQIIPHCIAAQAAAARVWAAYFLICEPAYRHVSHQATVMDASTGLGDARKSSTPTKLVARNSRSIQEVAAALNIANEAVELWLTTLRQQVTPSSLAWTTLATPQPHEGGCLHAERDWIDQRQEQMLARSTATSMYDKKGAF
jgi:hypothetical protein